MGLETGTYIDDLVVTNPTNTDGGALGAAHLRLIKSVLKNTFPDADRAVAGKKISEKSADYTIVAPADDNTAFVIDASSGTKLITLPSVEDTVAGFEVVVMRTDTGSGYVGIVTHTGELINNYAPLIVLQFWGQSYTFRSSGPGGGWFGVQSSEGYNPVKRSPINVVTSSDLDTNYSLATGCQAGDTVGGYVLQSADIFSLAGQTNVAENGIYICNGAGAATRYFPYNNVSTIVGTGCFVTGGDLDGYTILFSADNVDGTIDAEPILADYGISMNMFFYQDPLPVTGTEFLFGLDAFGNFRLFYTP
jgi:hypothetical protein